MSVLAPHFLLRANGVQCRRASAGGRWRFVLQSLDGAARVEAQDDEPDASAERLELLAIVRGLESLDEPSRVTVLSSSRSISRSFRVSLKEWRESDWQWERYGQFAPVKNADLWQRIDRATAIHAVECPDPAGSSADDLAAPPAHARQTADVPIIYRRGRRLRIDGPQKSESRSAKQETSSKHERLHEAKEARFRHSSLAKLTLSRISEFVFWICGGMLWTSRAW
jgi:ribonuclease HI